MFDFENNQTVEDINSVPEQYQGLYVEGDGGYQISESAMPLVKDYMGTNKSLEKERTGKKKANQESADRRHSLSAIRSAAEELGIDLDEDTDLAEAFKGYVSDLQSKAKNGEELKVDLEKVKDTMKRQHSEELGNKDSEIKARDATIQKMLVSSTAASALTKAGDEGNVMLPHIMSACKVVQDGEDENGVPNYEVRVLDDDGDFRTDGKGGYMGVEGVIEEMKADPKFAKVFDSDAPAGTGGRPGPTPKKPTSRGNLTSAQKIFKCNDLASEIS